MKRVTKSLAVKTTATQPEERRTDLLREGMNMFWIFEVWCVLWFLIGCLQLLEATMGQVQGVPYILVRGTASFYASAISFLMATILIEIATILGAIRVVPKPTEHTGPVELVPFLWERRSKSDKVSAKPLTQDF